MLLCLTANHQNASFDLLEKLSIGAPAAASDLVAGSAFVSGAVVLATCNRFEAYLDIDEPLTGSSAVAVESTIDAMSSASGVLPEELRKSVKVITGDAVAGHLFSVTAGLESVVVGEDEISGQVGRALEAARVSGTATSTLDTLFQTATRTSREVKNHTALGGAGRSLVRLALELASSRVTDWSKTRVLLVGTGQYAATTLGALRDRGATDVRVFSPSGRAAKFASKYGIEFETSLSEAIADSDVVLTCTSTLAITPADVPNDNRRLVIDLGLPRNVDPAVATLAGVELLDLDLISRHAPVEALTAATDARALIGDAAASYLSAATVEPAIVAFRSHVFDLLDAEIERAQRRSGDSTDTVAALRHLAGVLLHGPSVRARTLAREGRGGEFVAALDALYGIAPEAVIHPLVTATDSSDADDLAV
ncbi:glutamyl-tRNA reductase [Conyzicola nivalis]|uniref:Glutamyl-tRNA reductase n=1 Tax=Conyzicola nivalis TaxID=1477021 RepID=A0A916WL55_9MICO|nr:glutamyl-tRNA reductase [Conyzicola nivalis]GGB08321.1 glutamyl-tRNA reductase [Conyzicola nivalis]